MKFVTIDDIYDDVISVKESDIDEANEYVTGIGTRLGVAEGDFVHPARYIARRLASVYALYLASLRAVGTDGSVIFNGQENVDIYAQKLKYFRAEVERIEARLTASDFAQEKTAGRTIELGRG